MEKLKVEYLPIDSIREYENNAKVHTHDQIKQIRKSIEEFGMNDPIGIWHGEIVEGHGRLIACKELGMEEVPIIRLDELTDEQRRAYMLVHNKLTMNTDFDKDLLESELESIERDMSLFGFEEEGLVIDDIDGEVLDPEEPITRELGEANNYVVLEFMTEEEWEIAQVVFNLRKEKTADKNENIRRHGIGRVVEGKKYLEMLMEVGKKVTVKEI